MLKIGIVGFPNVGKSTLFKALTRQEVDISNYPFCTINPNVGIVKVPDERLNKLAAAFPRPNIIPAVVEFVDIAGLVKGASRGEGLGNKFLAHIREVDAILEVVRFFEKEDVVHVSNRINPAEDIEIINTELILADLETVNNRLEKLDKEAKSQDKAALKELAAVKKIKEVLEQGKFAKECALEKDEQAIVKALFLLTFKPIFYLYNYSGQQPKLSAPLEQKEHLFLDIKIEEELSQMEEKEIKEMGLESQIGQLIEKGFQMLDLIIFFTMNEKEIRAWEVKRGAVAPQAGGAIHTDFENKFIRAETIAWDKLIGAGSWSKARETGVLQTAGRDYIVQDGEVIYFLI